MDAFAAKYYLQNGKAQEATVLLLKDRISIGTRDENNEPLVIVWLYHQIIKDSFWKRGQAIVRCGTYPVQIIEVESKEFADKLESILAFRESSWIQRIKNKNVMRIAKGLGIFLTVLLGLYFFLIPFLAERLAGRVPVSYEEKLGDGIYDALRNNFILDEAKTFYTNEFFSELNIPTEYGVRISVVKDEITNAFAMPGGNIVVYDKMLAGMDHYEDLAALLSHEFIHVNKKHSTRALFRQLASSVFLSIIFGDIGSMANTVIRNADHLKGLNYSRKLEKEADLEGLKILSERKIDGNGFVRLFELLKVEIPEAGNQSAEWISSHPDLDKRIDYIRKSEWFNKNEIHQNETLKTLFFKIKEEE